jgi:lysine 6-dehydrogenase
MGCVKRMKSHSVTLFFAPTARSYGNVEDFCAPTGAQKSSTLPRHLLHAVLEPQILARPGEQDVVIIRIITRGLKDGQEQEAIVDLFDYYDKTTGFTSMERTTGWHAAIMAGFMAHRQTPSGGVPVELAVPSQVIAEEFRKRGFDLRISLKE